MAKTLRDEYLHLNLVVNGDKAKKELGDLEKSTRELNAKNRDLISNLNKLESAGKKNTKEWKDYNDQLTANNRQIRTNDEQMSRLRKTIGYNNLSIVQLRKEYRSLKGQIDHLDPNDPDWARLNKQLQQVLARMNEVNGGAVKMKGAMNSLKSMAAQLLPAFGFAAIASGFTRLLRSMIRVRSEFEKYEAVLTNSFGDKSKALESMKMLQEFAAKTPFSLQELTGAYVKLTNYGLKPTREELVKMGDLASSVGKGFDQLTEAMADAVTGEFERLKEFGIKARREGDRIKFTFKEQTTAVDNNAAAIKNYLLTLGELEGVAGSMEAIAKTTGGAISNMGDAWDNMLNSMGKQTGGAVQGIIKLLTKGINRMTKQIDIMNNEQLSFWEKWWGSTIGTNTVYDQMIEKQKESLRLAKERKEAEEEFFNQFGYSTPLNSDPGNYTDNETKAKKSLFEIQDDLLEQAKKLPETTEAEIIAKNKKIAVIEKEIDRLKKLGIQSKESLKLDELLEASDEKQRLAIQKYFSKLGEDALENFLNAIESERDKGRIDFSVVSQIQTEEEQQADPSTDYAVQKYQQTLDYKFALNQAMYEKGLIGEQQYQDQLTELARQAERERYEIKRENVEKYQQITGFAANFVGSLMDLELEKAGDNEEKKKQIRKKYADLNFAVTASHIIADTASAVMKALAELGPIAGPIAAAIVGATGTLQLGIANAERQKVKGYAEGKYPVPLRTGTYGSQPHYALFNEVPGYPEMVVDGRTFRTMQMNYPELINAIYSIASGKQPNNYGDGKYPANQLEGSSIDSKTIQKLTQAIYEFMNWRPEIPITDIDKKLKNLKDRESKIWVK